jgi:SNF2 family DNA or RNA helicase
MYTKTDIKLWEHQRRGVAQALAQRDYALFIDLGGGKTCTAINILARRFDEAGRVRRTLIVGPIAVVENWRRELARFSNIPAQDVVTLTGAGKKRVETLEKLCRADEHKILIMNYEGLAMADVHRALLWYSPEILIFDESHRCKSISAKRTRSAISLADRAAHRYILTGTPILNSPMDVFAQYRILDAGATFGQNFCVFRNHYFFDRNAGMPSHKYFPDWRPRDGAYQALQDRMYTKAMRVLKSECMDLPPLVRKRVYCEMSPAQAKNYREMLRSFIAYLDDKACVAELALTKGLRLQQILTGFFVDTNGAATVYEKNPRIDALRDTLENIPTGEKAIIWACFRENYRAIGTMLDELGIKYVSLVGGMKDSERQAAIDAFQDDSSVHVMLANQAAGGTGINLTAASYAIYYSRNFRLEDDLQSEARNYRGGSERHTSITRIDLVTPGTIDEVILDALASKENIANTILTIKGKLI